MNAMEDFAQPLEIVLITGMSGSGKSVALNALEDAGFYCVDNLPPELLLPFVELEQQQRARLVAIAIDVRSATSLPQVPRQLAALRHLTGRDAPVIEFLQAQPDVDLMLHHISHFLENWLDSLARDHRSYVTVAIGCTGGQHRSVYLVERLAQRFAQDWSTLTRHREIDAP